MCAGEKGESRRPSVAGTMEIRWAFRIARRVHACRLPRMAIRSMGFYSKSGGLFPRMREVVTEKKEVGSS